MPLPDGPDIDALIAAGRESVGLEYKQSAPWSELRVNLIRTVLGMTNTRGGGRIVIGVAERDGGYSPDGMSDEHIDAFPKEEELLRLATQKALRQEVENLRDLGLLPPMAGTRPVDEELFARQEGDI